MILPRLYKHIGLILSTHVLRIILSVFPPLVWIFLGNVIEIFFLFLQSVHDSELSLLHFLGHSFDHPISKDCESLHCSLVTGNTCPCLPTYSCVPEVDSTFFSCTILEGAKSVCILHPQQRPLRVTTRTSLNPLLIGRHLWQCIVNSEQRIFIAW